MGFYSVQGLMPILKKIIPTQYIKSQFEINVLNEKQPIEQEDAASQNEKLGELHKLWPENTSCLDGIKYWIIFWTD